jgi:DNA adenine methylase
MTVAEQKDLLVKKYKVNPVYAEQLLKKIPENSFNEETVVSLLKQKPKPFVKWVGGKRQLLKQFHELGALAPEGFDQTKHTYYEPFVGGGAVFFELLPKKAVLSDFNAELVTTYNTIKNDVESLIELLKGDYYIYDKERFLEIRALPQERELSPIETAARFIYLNRTAFNGMYRVNKSGHFNVPFGRYTNPQICDEENLRSVSTALKKVDIKNEGYEKVLNKAKAGDFVYFDPPYYPVSKTASFTTYTNDVFLERQQEELRDTFLELHRRGCKVALSNSDTPFINGLFEPFQKESITIHKVKAGRNINSNSDKRGKVFEVLVKNF